jgi:hypothetical protein
MGLFNLGSMIGAFAGPKVTKTSYSEPLNNQIDTTASGLTGYRNAQAGDLAKYSADIGTAKSSIDKMQAGDINSLTPSLTRMSTADPFAQYKQIGDYKTGLFDKFASGLADQGRLSENLLNSKLGYGGKPGSSFTNQELLDRISKNLAPGYLSLVNGIGNDYSTLVSGDTQNLSNLTGLLDYKAGIPLRTPGLDLAASSARTGMLNDEINAEQNLGTASKNNTAGFQSKKNKWAAAGDAADSSLNSAVDMALSAYTGGLYRGGNNNPTPTTSTVFGGNNSMRTPGINPNSGGANSSVIQQLLQLLNSGGGNTGGNSFFTGAA